LRGEPFTFQVLTPFFANNPTLLLPGLRSRNNVCAGASRSRGALFGSGSRAHFVP